MKTVAALAAFVVLSHPSYASDNPDNGYGDKGYWFYKEPKRPPKQPIILPTHKPKKDEPKFVMKKKKSDCDKEWKLSCGFREPKSFAEQEKMRDALMQDAYMHPTDANKVKQMQKYIGWILKQSINASKLWKYNMIQDPSLDPSVQNPISTYGIKLAMEIRDSKKDMVWKTIKDFNGKIIMFSKDDCEFCHKQAQPFYWLKQNTGMVVHGASLKGDCPAGVVDCLKGEKVTKAAQILGVKIVPAIYLYFPKNVWIKVSNGLITTEELQDRIYNFFIAWRSAVQKGMKETNSGGLNAPLDILAKPKDMSEFKSLLMKPSSSKDSQDGSNK